MQRTDAAMFITCYVGSHRPTEDKKSLSSAINRLVTEALGTAGDDIFIVLVPVPNDGFSFDQGELPLAEIVPCGDRGAVLQPPQTSVARQAVEHLGPTNEGASTEPHQN